jgi:peptidyl-prolyl cis-trans isomerase D
VQAGGPQPLSEVKAEIVARLSREKRVEKLRPAGEQLLAAARSSSLEDAAKARNLTVEKSPLFARIDLVQGLGQFNQAIGAAFTIPVGQVGGPFPANDGMVVIRVDSRHEADKAAFEAQKATQRSQLTSSLRQQRVEEFLKGLRESVKVADNRTKVQAQLRKQSGT